MKHKSQKKKLETFSQNLPLKIQTVRLHDLQSSTNGLSISHLKKILETLKVDPKSAPKQLFLRVRANLVRRASYTIKSRDIDVLSY